jgi:hypothetical protein
MTEAGLSKSLFIRGLQCHKALYLARFHPELKDPVPQSREILFEGGFEAGLLARELFPGGVTIPYEGMSYDEQVAMTERLIREGVTTFYEAAFRHDGVFVKADILQKTAAGWDLYEVKSSTSVKDVYMPDLGIQYYVLTGAGLSVNRAFLVHINNGYVRHGEIDVNGLFTVNDLTAQIMGAQQDVIPELSRQKAVLEGPTPEIDIGPQCHDPYDCDFIGLCWAHIPEMSVFTLRGNRRLPFDLYRQGIINLKEIPLDLLPLKQREQVAMVLDEGTIVSREAIRTFLDELRYPLYFLDFETISTPIPLFDGVRPYQNVPYQFSLHWIGEAGSPLRHTEYLALPGVDPRAELLEGLLTAIPQNACIVAYVASFEAGVLTSLAGWLPERAPEVERLIENLHDLASPFQKRSYYHWQFHGSYSLKAVLPVMAPDLSYEGFAVRNGEMATAAYLNMQKTGDAQELQRIRQDLLAYCRLDTLAMVRIVEALRELL